MYEVRGRLDVIAEELTASEEEEATADEDAFVMLQDSPDVFCRDCSVPTRRGAAAHAPHTLVTLAAAAQQMKVSTDSQNTRSQLPRCVTPRVCFPGSAVQKQEQTEREDRRDGKLRQ